MIPFDDRMFLALTMIGEARGDGNLGMECVGHTIMNRFKHPSWRGKTIREICSKPYQYSCWNTDDPNRKYLLSLINTDPIFIKALSIADDLIGEKISDITGGATYYYKIGSVMPKWALGKSPCYIYKNHEFFKDIS